MTDIPLPRYLSQIKHYEKQYYFDLRINIKIADRKKLYFYKKNQVFWCSLL